MSVQASQLIAKVSAEGVEETKSQLEDVGETTARTGGIFKSALAGGLSFASGVAGQALGFLKDQMVDSVKAAMAHQDVMQQTAAAIKSTGGASGMTSKSISDLANSLSRVTTFSNDTIQSGENLLLTFTGIGKDVLPQTTKTMLDMAQAMGGDTKGAAIMLGKALNDPATGMSALTRVGVTFSAEEQKQIKSMMAHNDVIGAQKVMLKELGTEFGGSATAAGKTFAGQLEILKNTLEDVKQKIGTAVLPILSDLSGFVSDKVMPEFDKFSAWFSSELPRLGKDFEPLLDPLEILGMNVKGMLIPAFERLGGMFHQLFAGNTVSGAGLFKDAIADIGNVLGWVTDGIDNFYEGVVKVQNSPIVGQLRQFASTLSSELGPPLKNIAGLLGGEFSKEFKDVGEDAQQVGGWFMSSVVPALKQATPGFESLGKTILTTVVPSMIQIRGVIADVIEHGFKVFAPIIEKIVPPLIRFAGILANDIANGLKFIMPYVLQAAKAIGDFADQIMDRVAPIITNWINDMTPKFQAFMKFWNSIWPEIFGILKGVWDQIVGIVKIAWALVSGIVKIGLDILGGNWKQAWEDFKGMLAGVWDGIKTYLAGAWEIIKSMFSNQLKAIQSIFGGIGKWFSDRWNEIVNSFKNVFGGLKDAATSIFNGVASAVKTAFNGVIDLIDGVIDKANSVKIGDVGLNIPHIPHLASGTLSASGGLTLVGEQGPELVMMPQGARVFPNSQLSRGASQSAGQPIILQIDGRTLATIILPHTVDAIRNHVGIRSI